MNVIEAFNAVQARTLENNVFGDGAGLTLVLEQLGVDPEDMELAVPSVLYEHDVNRIPISAGIVASFAAGAVYTRANHARGAEHTYVTAEMARRGAEAAFEGPVTEESLQAARDVLEAALGGPAVDPPTDDGAGA